MAERTCSIEGCEKRHVARGWCGMHYQRWKVYGDPSVRVRPIFIPGVCDVADCERPRYRREWCRRHFSRWERYGDPTAGYRSPGSPLPPCSVNGCTAKTTRIIRGMCEMHYSRWATKGDPGSAESMRILGDDEARFWSYVDKNGPVPPHRPDLGQCWLWTGGLNDAGYPIFGCGGRTRLAHRWAYASFVEAIPEGFEADHLCHVRACVNFERHLEPVTHEVNSQRRLWTRWAITDPADKVEWAVKMLRMYAPYLLAEPSDGVDR